MRPGLSVFDSKSLIALTGAFFLGLYQIFTRKVSEHDANETSLFFTSIIGIILMGFVSLFYWQPITLNFIIFFLGMGFFYSVALYFQIIALSKARASIVQPFHYTLVFWAIIFGYLFYNDFPDVFTIIGAIIISFSGIYVLTQKDLLNH